MEIKNNIDMNLIGKSVTHKDHSNIVWIIADYNRDSGYMKLVSDSKELDTHISQCKGVNN